MPLDLSNVRCNNASKNRGGNEIVERMSSGWLNRWGKNADAVLRD
jgi:hypothetical protein